MRERQSVRVSLHGFRMQQKKLAVIGNGVALFIDKPYQQLLGLEAGAHVSIDTDGQRLLIQATGPVDKPRRRLKYEPWTKPSFMADTQAKNADDARVSYFAYPTLQELLKLGLDETQFRRLYRGTWIAALHRRSRANPLELYLGELSNQRRNFYEDDFDSMRRLEALRRHLDEGTPMGPAIDAALAEVPLRPEIIDSDLYWPHNV
jgi:hypothetical protein